MLLRLLLIMVNLSSKFRGFSHKLPDRANTPFLTLLATVIFSYCCSLLLIRGIYFVDIVHRNCIRISYVNTYLGQSTKRWMLKVPLELTVRLKHTTKEHVATIRNDHPQNADFPQTYSKKEKKPFPVPIIELRRAARERLKGRLPQRPVSPARRGLTVKSLVPLAHNVLNARTTVINNLRKLLKVVPVHSCG